MERFISFFQPGEEGGGGALEMMKDGLFTRFPMDAVFRMHNWPDYPAGTFGIREGPVMASSNVFKIRITGRGTHAALTSPWNRSGADCLPNCPGISNHHYAQS
jgi:hippurate hydrolase